jgi:P-type Ca2+ transporter type 2B
MITKHMLANMVGQAMFQITVIMVLLFKGPDYFDFPHGHSLKNENSEHYTFIFNSFVWMQLFNEINCRMLKGEGKRTYDFVNGPLTSSFS